MTFEKALAFIRNSSVIPKETLLFAIGKENFDRLLNLGYITTGIGKNYWITTEGISYYDNMVKSGIIFNF